MTFYDRTKEDSRPWRDVQDAQGQDADDAAIAKSEDIEEYTSEGGITVGFSIKPVTVEEGDTAPVEVVSTSEPVTLAWESSDVAVATVADGVVTGVAEGEATITASHVVKGVTLRKASTTATVTGATEPEE